MKKVTMILAALVCSIGAINAQKGTILAYGNVGFSSSKSASEAKSSSFELKPGIGYQFNNNWTAGLNIAVTGDKDKNAAGVETDKNSGFGVGPFVRYTHTVSSIFSVFGQLDATIGTSKNFADVKTNTFNAGVWPGIAINVNKGCALSFAFGGLSYGTSKLDVAGAKTASSLDFTFGKAFNIGIQKNFKL